MHNINTIHGVMVKFRVEIIIYNKRLERTFQQTKFNLMNKEFYEIIWLLNSLINHSLFPIKLKYITKYKK